MNPILPFASAAFVLAALAPPVHASDLVLSRIMLSAAGVGYYEYATVAEGTTTLTLDVPRAQVDDILASLVVFDEAGRIGTVTLPGEDAVRAAFATLPLGPEALGSALAALNALRGVELIVRGPRPMTGLLLRAETASEPAGGQGGIPRTRVTLLTADGLQQFVLEDAESVQVADPGLRERLAAALAALRGATARDVRRLKLELVGEAHRRIRIGYVAATPVWKATYRLIMPAGAGAPARLQAWAVLENDSATDWRDVDLTLQYGNPVTFHQALYRSYYVARPDVPVEVLGRILPGLDTPAYAPATTAEKSAGPKLIPPSATARSAVAAPTLAAPEPAAEPTEGTEATLFHLPAPVSLPAGQSASLPFLDRSVLAERIALLPQERTHPLAAVRLTNTTGATLPAGILTLYDGDDATAFAGDGRLGGLPNGESRLLTFAEDLRTAAEWQIDAHTALTSVTAAQGVLHLQRRDRWTARLTLVAPASEPRHLLVEINKRPGAVVTSEDGLTPAEETAAAWRFALALRPGETRRLIIHVDRTTAEAMTLRPDGDDTLVQVLGEQGLTPTARAALQQIADLRAALAAHETERDRLIAERTEIERDEERVRQNLAAVPAGEALHGRLVETLAADEARLADLGIRLARAQETVRQATAALRQAVTALHL